MAENKIGFFNLLCTYGIARFFKALGLWVSLVLAGFYYFFFYAVNKGLLFDKQIQLHNTMISVASSLFGLLFAAFAIIIALSDKEFVGLLKKLNLLSKILFPFWYTSFLYLFSIIINMIVTILNINSPWVFTGGAFIFLWAIAESFYLISTTVKFGLYRAELYS